MGRSAGAAGIGLDHWPQCADRLSLGRPVIPSESAGSRGIARARTGCHTGSWQRDRGSIAAGDPHRTDRIHANPRSGGRRICREPGAAGGNVTGFALFEYGVSAKYVELLKEIAPRVREWRSFAILAKPPGPRQFAAIQALAPSFGMEVIPLSVRDGGEIERPSQHSRVPRMAV